MVPANATPSIYRDVIGKMGDNRRTKVAANLPYLFYPNENPIFVCRCDRQADEIAYIAFTDLRLIALTEKFTIVLDVGICDIETYRIGFFNNLAIWLRGEQIKLGNILEENDKSRVKRVLDHIVSATVMQREEIRGRLSSFDRGALFGFSAPDLPPHLPQLGLNVVPPVAPPKIAEAAFGQISELDRVDIEAKLFNLLEPSEQVRCAARVLLFEVSQPGWVVITDRRLFTITSESQWVIDIPFDEIEAFDAKQNDLFNVTAEGHEVVIGLLERHSDVRRISKVITEQLATQNKVSKTIAHRIETQPAPAHSLPKVPIATGPQPAPVSELSARIAELTALHAQGLLTDEELTAAKAKALGI